MDTTLHLLEREAGPDYVRLLDENGKISLHAEADNLTAEECLHIAGALLLAHGEFGPDEIEFLSVLRRWAKLREERWAREERQRRQ